MPSEFLTCLSPAFGSCGSRLRPHVRRTLQVISFAELRVAERQIRSGDGKMPKIIWSCSNCGTVLPLWQIKCTNCHRLALSWLHLILASGTALSAVVLLLKFL
jgi:hypothetical protein